MLKALTQKLTTDEIDEYLKYLIAILENPIVEDFYPSNAI